MLDKNKILNMKATFFIVAIYLIGQLYERYDGNSVSVHWWISDDRTMPQSWAVKFLCEEIKWFMLCCFSLFAITFKGDRKRLLISVYVLIIWSLIDIAVWFYNFKTYGYGYVIGFVMLIEMYWQHRYNKKIKNFNRMK